METLPDLLPLSDDELSALLARLEGDEDAVSRRRRVLHGRIDILRAERTARLKAQVAAGSFQTHAPTSLERPLYAGTGELAADADLEPLPDLASMDDDALWAEIRRLETGGGRYLAQPSRSACPDRHRLGRTHEALRGPARTSTPATSGPILGGGQ